MKNILCSEIEICGISDTFPSFSNTFKEFQIQKNLCIPAHKPDIEEIIYANICTKIWESYTIPSPNSISQEGQVLTQNKLIVYGEILLKIQYTAYSFDQSVHASEFKIPFSNYIVMDEHYNPDLDSYISPYIEDVFIRQVSKRNFYTNIMLLLDAKYC